MTTYEDSLRELVSKIQSYRAWSERLLKVIEPSFPRTLKATVANEWPALGAAFIFRAANILEATLDLPEWRVSAAAILVRSLYEHVTTFAWLAADPSTNLTKWDLEDIRQAVALHREAIKLGFGDLLQAEQLAALERKLKASQPASAEIDASKKQDRANCTKKGATENKPSFPQMAVRARDADAHWGKFEEAFRLPKYSLQGMYPVVFRNFSSIVHGGGQSVRTLISAGPTPDMWCVGEEAGTGFSNAFTIAGARQMAHGQWTEIEARGVLEAWKRSGFGIEKFARSRGLVPQRLWWWKKKLGVGRAAGSAPALVPVRVTEARAEARRGEPVTVLPRSGHMIKVGRDFDESAFARVVALLEQG